MTRSVTDSGLPVGVGQSAKRSVRAANRDQLAEASEVADADVSTNAAEVHAGQRDEAESAAPMTHRQILKAMSGLMLALLVAILSSTIVSNALPVILADLGGSQSQYTWVVTAMLLTSTASTPIWGKLSDLVSKKLLYQLAITIFTAGSVLGGFAPSMPALIGFRAVQGIGMGGLQALIQVVIAAMVSPRERGRYSGYIGATFAVATVSGPLLGGLIVDTPWLGWRWCFWVTVPIAVLAFLVLGKTLKLPVLKRRVSIDWFGALFLVGGVSLILVWTSLAGKQFAWYSPETALFAGGGLAALLIAVVIESKVREPIVPLGMFRDPTIVMATLGTVAVGTAMFGGAVFLGQYFQIARGYTPTYAGLMTLPMVLGLFLSSTISGQVISRRTGRVKPFLIFGAVVLIAGMGLLSTIDHQTHLALVGCYLALMGIGVGSLLQNLILAVQNNASGNDMGSVTSVVTFFRTLGGSAGVSVLGAVLATQVTRYVTAGLSRVPGAPSLAGGSGGSMDVAGLPAPIQTIVRDAYGDAMGDLFFVAACVSVVTLIAVLFIKDAPLSTTIDSHAQQDSVPRPSTAARLGEGSSGAEPIQDRAVVSPSGVLATPVLSGTVVDSGGNPIPNAVLTLTDVQGRRIERVHTESDGSYRFELSNGGTYMVIASAGRYQPAASRIMADGAPVTHDIEMFGAGGLSGVVRSEGHPVSEVLVVLTDAGGEVVGSATTSADGRFTFTDLVGGAYSLSASAEGYRAVANAVSVTAGRQSTVDVALVRGIELTGMVRSARLDQPVPDAWVTVLDSTGEVVGTSTTDAHGGYSFTGFPEGEYTVIVSGYPPVAAALRLTGERAQHDVALRHEPR